MVDLCDELLVYEGRCFSVYFHRDRQGSSDVYSYYVNCDDVTRASLLFLVKRISDTGFIYDGTKFRIEDRKHRIFCFKPRKDRFFCFFFLGRTIVITSAYKKKRQNMDRRALEKAVRIKKLYFSE